MNTEEQKVESFLRESNAIEGVYDKRSLEDAKEAWKYLMTQEKLTTAAVLITHRILMENQPIENMYKGHFRKCPVYVGGYEALTWKMVPLKVREWIECMNAEDPHDWKQLHVEYEKIHPFVDGNGRTGRMFMNWHRVKVLRQPIYVIRESYRQQYYKWFKK